ncbi:MAG TPA: cellulase family glycosylhydrolase [Streptosporangiaceae bacterium]|nr:cellulase family glycosylhydrolase [Streptosporangiaceae bacterium]
MARARLAGVGSGLGWRGLVAGSALALAAAVAVTAAAPSAQAGISTAVGSGGGTSAGAAAGSGARAGAGAACGKVTGPFKVSGTLVLDASQEPFISYGLTVPGLQGPEWTSYTGLDLQKITATATDWCANTVRLQLNQDDLLGPDGTGVNHAYLAAVQAEVSLAEHDQLAVVLNDETNLSPSPAQYTERGPTPATETFWKVLAKLYGNDPQVIFDLFNEPRMYSSGMSQTQEWQLWLNGGLFQGVYYPFGMAQLAGYVRTTLGARNLFWIEGPNFSASFAGMVQQHALLHVSGVVYSLHHPAGQPGPTAWNDDFGYLATDGVAPVVDGEWTNYEPAPTTSPTSQPTSCWSNAPTSVPEFLKWLASNSIGLNAYQLQPGFLIRSYTNLALPTTMNAKTWNCQSSQEPEPGQGAGSEVLAWFQQQNG